MGTCGDVDVTQLGQRTAFPVAPAGPLGPGAPVAPGMPAGPGAPTAPAAPMGPCKLDWPGLPG